MTCIAQITNPKRLRVAHRAAVHGTQSIVLRECALQAHREARRTWHHRARRQRNRLSPVLITDVSRRLGVHVNLGMRPGNLSSPWFGLAHALASVAGPSPILQRTLAASSVRSFSES